MPQHSPMQAPGSRKDTAPPAEVQGQECTGWIRFVGNPHTGEGTVNLNVHPCHRVVVLNHAVSPKLSRGKAERTPTPTSPGGLQWFSGRVGWPAW